jgi:hypothetical protein
MASAIPGAVRTALTALKSVDTAKVVNAVKTAGELATTGKASLDLLRNSGGGALQHRLGKFFSSGAEKQAGTPSDKSFSLSKLSDFAAKLKNVDPGKLTQAHVEESGNIVREGLKALKEFMLDKASAHGDEGMKQKIDDFISRLEKLPLPGHESFKPDVLAKYEQAIADLFGGKPSHKPESASEPEHKPESGKVEADAGHAHEAGEGKVEAGMQQKPAAETPVKAEDGADHKPDHKTDMASGAKDAAGPLHSEKNQVAELRELRAQQAQEQQEMAAIKMEYDMHMAMIEMLVSAHQKILEMFKI